VSFRPFWSKSGEPIPNVKEGHWPMLVGPVVLAILGALFGIFPDTLAYSLVTPTVDAIVGSAEPAKELKLWAGINVPLFLSIATFVLGFILYAQKLRLRALLIRWSEAAPTFDNGWDKLLAWVAAGSKALTQALQTGQLRRYMLITFGTTTALLAVTMLMRPGVIPPIQWPDVEVWDWLVFLLVLFGAYLTVATNSRITAIAGLGVVGIGMAMIFILFSAPDVAITQLLVETLVVVLFAAAALRLPTLQVEPLRKRWMDAVLALGLGLITTVILLMVVTGPIDRELTTYFEQNSWTAAYGQNIVNVILVDFRALDTFGEIAVVRVAAVAIFALLRSKPEKEET
jgi:multicomponent Na+:H+ antiporter subunit A